MNANELTVTATLPAAANAPAKPAPAAAEPFFVAMDGPEGCPQGPMPGKAVYTEAEMKAAANPLQYVPVVGTIYRAITGETIPAPLKIAGSVVSSAIFGGPIGALACIAASFAEELIRLGPDTSRPALPAGFAMNGSEGGVSPVTPGTLADGAYTTLATTVPDFLQRPTADAAAIDATTRGLAAYEWQRRTLVEHGVL